jgi:hypothetical protein
MNDKPSPGDAIKIGEEQLVLRTALQRKSGHWWAELQVRTRRLWVEVRQNDKGEWERVEA